MAALAVVLGATFFAGAFLADVFWGAVFLAGVFLAVVFLAVAFLAVDFLGVVLGATFFAGVFLAVVFLALVFFVAFLAEASGAGSRPVIFLAAETTAFTIFPRISVMTPSDADVGKAAGSAAS